MERKVVITGCGIWSCLGTTLEEVRQSLYDGRSGIQFSQERKDAGFRSALCAAVPPVDLKPYVNRNFRQFMPEEAQYAYMATRDALLSWHIHSFLRSSGGRLPWPEACGAEFQAHLLLHPGYG